MFDLNKAIKDKIQSMSTEALQAIVNRVEAKNITGPTISEYLYGVQQSLEIPSFQYTSIDELVEYSEFEKHQIDTFSNTVCTFNAKSSETKIHCSIKNDTYQHDNSPHSLAA